MREKKKPIISFVALVILIIGAVLLYSSLSKKNIAEEEPLKEESTEEAQLAPDFTVLDLEGEEVNLDDYKGKYIVLNFWASWCGFCRDEMEGFNNIYNDYLENEDLKILMVNVTDGSQETKENADTYYESNGFDFPIYYDVTLDAATKYGARSLPLTYLINKEGEIVGGKMGYFEEDLLREAIIKMMED